MNRFRQLYESSPNFSLAGMTLSDMYDVLSIPDKMVLMQSTVDEELVNIIIISLTPSEDFITYYEINTLKEAFFYSTKLFDNSSDWQYFIAVHELRSVIGSRLVKFKPFSDTAAWEKALTYLKCYIELKGIPNEYTLCIGMETEIHRIESVKRLQKLGVSCEIDNENTLLVTNLTRSYREVSYMMERIGGTRFVNNLLSILKYDKTKRRFIVIPECNPDPQKVKPSIPIGYLLNLAYRKTSTKGSENGLKKYWFSVINLATDICVALYPVQSYFGWSDIFYDSPSEYMKKWAIYDSLFSMQQMSQDFCRKIMNYLFKRLNADGRQFARNFTLAEFNSLMNEIFDHTKEKEFVQMNRSQLVSVKDNLHKLELIEEISNKCVNPNYEDPLSYDCVNWSNRPVIGLPNGDLLLYPASIGAYGWYELMMTLFREYDHKEKALIEAELKIVRKKSRKYIDIDNFIGYALEDFVKDMLSTIKIVAKCGKYNASEVVGECDVIIEDSNKIIMMELKKKNLTRAARQGYLYQIILDLAGSILFSQEQAFRTEMLLRRNGVLELKDNNSTYNIEYGGRKCEKVTITLNEYGPLHERAIQQKVLDAFYKYEYSVNPDEIKMIIKDSQKAQETIDNFARMEKKRKSLVGFVEEIARYQKEGRYDPFFDSWFFSIEQLCYLIEKSTNIKDFIEKFNKLKYIVLPMKNFWAEVDYKLSL